MADSFSDLPQQRSVSRWVPEKLWTNVENACRYFSALPD